MLSIKLGLFGAMLVFAAINRWRLTPSVARHAASASERTAALRRLRANARIEQVLGIAILVVVGALGVTIPAVHG